jgi:iron complex outermembrane recepter protein
MVARKRSWDRAVLVVARRSRGFENMSKKTQTGQRKSLLTGASVLAAAAAAMTGTPAMAQDAEEEEAIVVTGTRLVRQDFEAISPITTVGAEQLELTATLTTDSLLNELPQIVPGNTRTSNNAGGEDFATVDLRGLGTTRTLVLINGERVPASSTTGVVDLNTIPASLISRIEVVTGGASAVYGSDAVAGVVNFVLKDDYEGAEVNLTYGAEMETGNAAEFEINGLVGGNFANGRGNLTAYASYYNRESVLQSEYDYSRTSAAVCYDAETAPLGQQYFICDSNAEAIAHVNGPNGIWDGGFDGAGVGNDDHPIFLAGGSATPAWGWITNNPGNPFGAVGGGLSVSLPGQFGAGNTDTNCDGITAGAFQGAAVNSGNLSFNDAGQLTPRNLSGACAVPFRTTGTGGGSSRYNFAPDNFLILPAERIALTTNGHYDVTDDITLNLLMNYSNSRVQVQLAPTPVTGLEITLTPAMRTAIQGFSPDLWTALQTRTNPYAPFIMDRRTNELGTRNGYSENSSFYFLTGLNGSLGENWDWNLAASYGQSHFISRLTGSANKSAFLQGLSGCQALGAGPDGTLYTLDDVNQPLAGLRANCEPLDIFGPNTLTPTMVNFLSTTTFSQVIVEENRLTGYVRGDLFELPAGAVAAVFGFEYRDSQLEFRVDNEQKQGNIYGFNALQDQQGSIDVYELYTEIAVPLISEAPFAHYLGLEAGFRRSNYSTVGNVDTYKIGGEWAPTEWLRFRAVFNEATRAPNVFELFQAGDQGFPSYTDPCADADGDGIPNANEPPNTNTTNDVLAGQCSADIPGYGTFNFAQNNAQVQAFSFGNPNLTPETAETMTYGVVFQPDWFPVGDLRASVDYYQIEVTDVVAALGAQFFINDCYTVAGGNAAGGCGRIVRTGATGQIFSVDTTISNQASLETEGIDVQVEWSLPIGPGQLTINELYSILESFQFNGNEFAGTTSAAIGGAFPDYKSVLSVSYNVGDWTLFGRWNYVPEMTSSTFGGGTFSPEASYFDVSTRWNVTDAFTLTVNIDNITDEYPPQTADGFFSQANTDPQVYRVLGRSFAISGRYRF